MFTGHAFDPGILREYDVRGIVGRTLTVADALALGRAFGTYVANRGGRTVATGYDGRLSSPELSAALREGLISVGMAVTDVGLGPSPMLYFAVKHLGLDAGVMNTGSHNPPDYNGFKMLLSSGPVYGEAVQEIGRIAAGGAFAEGHGSQHQIDISQAYIDRLVRDYTAPRGLKIAWDAGNGSGGAILERLARKLPGEHVLLYTDIDGRFPNHHPDPTVEANLEDLRKAVLEHGCDLGIGLDGDADRIGALDETGRVIWGDQLIAIYAQEVLKTHPGAPVIADVKSSRTVFEEIARLGGQPVMWKTGHSLIKGKMAEINAPLAGEMSGHIFFADKWYGFDDALYCGVRLASQTANSGGPLSAIVGKLPHTFNTPETRFQVDEDKKLPAIEGVKARLAEIEGIEVNDLDGVRVTSAEGWWLLRASNTQDVLVARAEAFSPEGLDRLKAQIVEQLAASGVDAPPGF